jgi:hypothetical protein
MSPVPTSSLEQPAPTGAGRSNATDALDALNHQWDLATVEIMRAQLEYSELEGRGGIEDRVVAEAWLRLWRAEERQRELAGLIGQRLEATHRRISAEDVAAVVD